uniref:Uncharacterized protein n=1 Tax=Anguilla anguilla TaxID=7936 RepID=A0A0E9UJX6_ANGAN
MTKNTCINQQEDVLNRRKCISWNGQVRVQTLTQLKCCSTT